MGLLCNTTINVAVKYTSACTIFFFCVSSLQVFIPCELLLMLPRNLRHESHILPNTRPKPVSGLWFLVTDKMSFSGLGPLQISFMLS